MSFVFIGGGTRETVIIIAASGVVTTAAVVAFQQIKKFKPVPPGIAPVNTALPVITGTPTEGETLTCSTGTWDNSPTSFVYTWKRNGLAILGAHASTYTLVSADVGKTISCAVTAQNSWGSAIVQAVGVGPIAANTLGGTGTLSAPTLGYPSGGLLPVTIPNDWQSGDVLKVATSASEDMSSPTILTHTLSDSDTPGSTISIGLSMSGVGYIVAFGSHSGTDSQYLSNEVGFGDATKPIIATSATQSHPELTQYAVAITADKTISKAEITGGADQVQFEVYQDGSGDWFYRPFDDGTFNYDASVFVGGGESGDLQITVWDPFGNASDPLDISDSVTAVAKTVTLVFTPTASTFTSKTGATDNTLYQSNIGTVTGPAPGIAVPVSVAGTNFSYSKNGGAFTTADGTVVAGDTIQQEGETPGGAALGTVYFNKGTTHETSYTYTIADAAVGLSATNKNPLITLTGTPPLSFSTYSGSSNHQIVSADTSKPSGAIRQWEFTLTSLVAPSQMAIGAYSGTAGAVNFNQTVSPEPGRSGQPNGFFYDSGTQGAFADYNATSVSVAAWTATAGDVFTFIWDSIAHTIKLYGTRSGTSTLICTATGVTDANMCPFFGCDTNGVTGTVNFGASAFTYPLSNTAGAVAYNA